MPTYAAQTVVQPSIPNACMTPLERWLLEQMFECEPDEHDRTYFCAPEGITTAIDGADARLGALLREDASPLAAALWEALHTAVDPDWLDTSDIGHAGVFQGIVARHPGEVPYVTVETAYTCSRMRPNGFGGAAELITATGSRWMGTGAWLEEQIEAATGAGEIGGASAPVG